MKWSNAFILLALLCCGSTLAQEWIPRRNVEIVVSSVPGGSNDKTARTVERILVGNNLGPSSVTVVNKSGSGGNIAYTYLPHHPAHGPYLLIGTPGLVTGHIIGTSQLRYTDFTPIASLINDYTVFVVNAASPIRNGKDL